MKQGIIFGILITLFSAVLVFTRAHELEGEAQVILIHDGEEIFSSPFLEKNQQVIWFIEPENEEPFVLQDEEIINYFDFDITVSELAEKDKIDFDQIYDKVGTEASINFIINKDGYVEAYEANCPDKLDVKMGKIFNSTKVITCVPHKLVIKITGVEAVGETDA